MGFRTIEEKRAYQRAWEKAWRKKFPNKAKEKDAKKAASAKVRGYKPPKKEYVYKPETFERRCAVVEARYGLSKETYIKMIEDQNDLCLICNKPETWKNRAGNFRPLSVDHCHETGRVRGLLCTRCNAVLGYVDDDMNILKSAINYLKGN